MRACVRPCGTAKCPALLRCSPWILPPRMPRALVHPAAQAVLPTGSAYAPNAAAQLSNLNNGGELSNVLVQVLIGGAVAGLPPVRFLRLRMQARACLRRCMQLPAADGQPPHPHPPRTDAPLCKGSSAQMPTALAGALPPSSSCSTCAPLCRRPSTLAAPRRPATSLCRCAAGGRRQSCARACRMRRNHSQLHCGTARQCLGQGPC